MSNVKKKNSNFTRVPNEIEFILVQHFVSNSETDRCILMWGRYSVKSQEVGLRKPDKGLAVHRRSKETDDSLSLSSIPSLILSLSFT